MPSLYLPDPALAKELEIILDHHGSGTLAPQAQETSLPVSTPATPGGTNGSLGPNEYVELLAEEYWPPFEPDGTQDDLRGRDLILDAAAPSTSWWYQSGRADLNTSPPRDQRFDAPGSLTFVGGGLLEALAILAAGPLPGEDQADVMGRAVVAAAVPRAANSVIVRNLNAVNTVNGSRHTRWWGHRYTADEIRSRFAGMVLGGTVRIRDAWANNGKGIEVTLQLPEVPVTPENWSKIVGGAGQDRTSVYPFRRWAINAQATAGNQAEYDFTFTGAAGSNVGTFGSTTAQTDQYQNLDFNYAPGASGTQLTQPNILILLGWGVRALVTSADANQTDLTATPNVPPLGSQYVRLVQDTPHEAHPNNGLPASNADNPQHFGWTYPVSGGKTPTLYRPLRRQSGYRIPIVRRRGVVAMQDSGAAVQANTVGAAVEGVLIQNYTALSVVG
jgi:hypothetical protein